MVKPKTFIYTSLHTMRISDSLVEKLLQGTGNVSAEQLKTLKEQEKTEKKPLQDLAIKNSVISEKDLTKLYAKEIDVPFVEFNPHEIKRKTLAEIPERIAQQYKAVFFDIDADGNRKLAMEDLDDIKALSLDRKSVV